jgi:hypothetical protein
MAVQGIFADRAVERMQGHRLLMGRVDFMA